MASFCQRLPGLQVRAAPTLTAKGQIVIPADIRARFDLTPRTQLEFVDVGGVTGSTLQAVWTI